MLFTSYGFILFVAFTVGVYYSVPKRFQWIVLLAASYCFYFIAGPSYVLYILATTVSTYLTGKWIMALTTKQKAYLVAHKASLSKEEKKHYKSKIKKKQWHLLVACLFFNFGILAVIKYGAFVVENINGVIGSFGGTKQLTFMRLALPLGLSFYTFQTMGYIIDVYRGKYKAEANIFKLALFISFFPQLIQGPISRFDDLKETLFKQHDFQWRNITSGMERVGWGYFKKVVIADRLLVGVNTLIQDVDTYRGAFVFVAMLFYAYQLYADFTGGIDITIGIAQMLGIRIKENFERPYFSKSIEEYWRRWHITLGTWFKEYLFYPISVCKPMLKLSKRSRHLLGDQIGKRIPVYIATISVWFTTGLWHGAHWNFIVWGLVNCFVILVSQECKPLYIKFHERFDVKEKVYFRVFQVIRTILLMSSIRLFDCYRDVGTTFKMFGSMFTTWNWHTLGKGTLLNIGLTGADYMVLSVGLIVMVWVSLLQRKGSVRDMIHSKPTYIRYTIRYAVIIAIIIFGAYGVGYDASQFIYNQF